MLTTTVSLLKTRGELLVVEWEEEKLRLTHLLFYGALTVLLGGVGVVFLAIFLTVLFWESHRLWVLGTFATLFLTAGFIGGVMVRRLIVTKSSLFAASLAELDRDESALR
ncbi:MAG: phage holin family protein [Rhodocyclaceae bacterium]|nr:phage holin family protein [Rhodocyclaceae bacterium]